MCPGICLSQWILSGYDAWHTSVETWDVLAWFGLASFKLLPSVMGTACPTYIYTHQPEFWNESTHASRSSPDKPSNSYHRPQPSQNVSTSVCTSHWEVQVVCQFGTICQDPLLPTYSEAEAPVSLYSWCEPDNVMFGSRSAALSTLPSLLPATCLYGQALNNARTLTQFIAFLLIRPVGVDGPLLWGWW